MSNGTSLPQYRYDREWAVVKLDDLYDTIRRVTETVEGELHHARAGHHTIADKGQLRKLHAQLRRTHRHVHAMYSAELVARAYAHEAEQLADD